MGIGVRGYGCLRRTKSTDGRWDVVDDSRKAFRRRKLEEISWEGCRHSVMMLVEIEV